MDTDLDPDDTIGQRFGALRTYTPPVPIDDAWTRVETRRRRRQTRRYTTVAVVVVIAVVGSVAAIASLRSPDRRIHVVTPPDVHTTSDPPIVSVRPPATNGDIDVQPAGPYRAGQSVRAFVNPSPDYRVDDPYNETAELCFEYGGGEICDGTVRSVYVKVGDARIVHGYALTLPGWVHTPTGLQPCHEVACRIEIATSGGGHIGTPSLTIDSGPKPTEPVRLNGVHRDESLVSLHIDGLLPDPSWTAANLPQTAELPPGGLSICAFAERLLCDGLVRPDPPPFDGRPHDVTVETNRLLLTSRGWVDCVHYVCALAISRTIDVEQGDGGYGAGDEIIAIVPYRLPATTKAMERPTLTLDRTGPFTPEETVTVTMHDPPPNVDLDGLLLGQCAADRLDLAMDCGYRFDPWTRSADGSLHMEWRISACTDPRGCYLAVWPPSKGYPAVARTTGRFTASP